MRSKTLAIGTVVIFIGLSAWVGMAQNQMQHRSMAQAAAQTMVHDNIVTLAGTVTAVNLAPGQGMPAITFQENVLGPITVLVGPYRVLADAKFDIKTGQVLQIKAFPDPRLAQAYVATEIRDSQGATVVLRDAAGMPHAGGGAMGMGRGGAMGRGMMHDAGSAQGTRHMHGMQDAGACEYCANLDLQAKKTFVGTVQSVDMGPGQEFPHFTLLAGNEIVSVVAGPFWILERAGFQISQGDSLSVTAYPSLRHNGTYVAAEILNVKTNRSIKLRDENGVPIGMRGRGPMRGIQR